MNDSILTSIKKPLGLDEDYDAFDADLILLINTQLMTLSQFGVGAKNFLIKGKTETWADFVGDFNDIAGCQTYVYLKVKMIFDPPSNSFSLNALKEEASTLEWRLLMQVEEGRKEDADLGDDGVR